MTPEEYIEKLKEVQRTLDSVKEDLDRAIDRMQRRIETGYESMERDSRLAALAGREYVKLADSSIYEAATAKIDYYTEIIKSIPIESYIFSIGDRIRLKANTYDSIGHCIVDIREGCYWCDADITIPHSCQNLYEKF